MSIPGKDLVCSRLMSHVISGQVIGHVMVYQVVSRFFPSTRLNLNEKSFRSDRKRQVNMVIKYETQLKRKKLISNWSKWKSLRSKILPKSNYLKYRQSWSNHESLKSTKFCNLVIEHDWHWCAAAGLLVRYWSVIGPVTGLRSIKYFLKNEHQFENHGPKVSSKTGLLIFGPI